MIDEFKRVREPVFKKQFIDESEAAAYLPEEVLQFVLPRILFLGIERFTS
jgi:hypothetical protein